MDYNDLINDLERTGKVFEQLFSGLSKEEQNWKQAPEKWSTLQIACHMHDEEIEDFRERTAHVLNTPDAPMRQIKPASWVESRNYADQDYDTVVANFLAERKKSLEWLRSLENPAWDNAYQHPKVGPLTASFFLTNWAAHDYLHIRQLMKLKYDYAAAQTGHPVDYAGEW